MDTFCVYYELQKQPKKVKIGGGELLLSMAVAPSWRRGSKKAPVGDFLLPEE
jgi:hypothetical protein